MKRSETIACPQLLFESQVYTIRRWCKWICEIATYNFFGFTEVEIISIADSLCRTLYARDEGARNRSVATDEIKM